MTPCIPLARAALAMGVILALGLPASAAREVIPFDDALIRIEVNDTDGDAGIQVFLDGEGWDRVRIFDPDGRKVLDLRTKGTVRALGLTELFSESEEPEFSELPLDEFLALFPEGDYRYWGRTVEGDVLTGMATLTHTLPDAPVILAPTPQALVDPNDAVISWAPVPDPPGSQIVGYQVIVEQEEPLRVLSLDLPASTTSVSIPPEFFDPSVSEYKFEVLSIEASGNQTITEQSFETE